MDLQFGTQVRRLRQSDRIIVFNFFSVKQQVETTELHLVQHSFVFHAKGLFLIDNSTFLKVRLRQNESVITWAYLMFYQKIINIFSSWVLSPHIWFYSFSSTKYISSNFVDIYKQSIHKKNKSQFRIDLQLSEFRSTIKWWFGTLEMKLLVWWLFAHEEYSHLSNFFHAINSWILFSQREC